MPNWQKVAAAGDLYDDTGTVVTFDKQEIALFKVGDSVYAIDNECPHRQGPLGEGDLEGEIVTCPFHAWQINVRTGQVVDFPDMCTRTFPCRVMNGEVLIDADCLKP
jgi:NAD(P)H-dependent nitrite reductase small subunit